MITVFKLWLALGIGTLALFGLLCGLVMAWDGLSAWLGRRQLEREIFPVRRLRR